MRSWLSRLFGHRDDPRPVPPAAKPAPMQVTPKRASTLDATASDREARALSDVEIAFLSHLYDPPTLASLDSLPPDDRTFVAGVQRRLRTRELELPVLPEMALRLGRMFREGAAVSEFVKLINSDASLAVEVLKTANTALYASGSRLTSLQDAIMRIGLDRLQSVLMVAHLRGKVLKAGPFEAEADLLLELAMPIGQLASKVAGGRESSLEICFMRGALLHVEHLVILGATGAVARDVKRAIAPSPQALHHAFARSGRAIREALAAQWNLPDLLLGGDGEADLAKEYELLRRALICRWLRMPIPAEASAVAGLDAALGEMPPRVPAAAPDAEGGATVPLAS